MRDHATIRPRFWTHGTGPGAAGVRVTAQPALTAYEPEPPPLTLAERADAWMAANPQVVDLFDRFALEAARRGRQRFGAKAIVERMRWWARFEAQDPDGFKVNNSYVSAMARRFRQHYPEHAGLFETRGGHG